MEPVRTPLDGYKTYFFLALWFLCCVARSRFGIDIPEEALNLLLVGAGLSLRQAVGKITNGDK